MNLDKNKLCSLLYNNFCIVSIKANEERTDIDKILEEQKSVSEKGAELF